MVLADGDFWRPNVNYQRAIAREAMSLNRQFPNISVFEHAQNLLEDGGGPPVKKQETAKRQPIQRGTVIQCVIPVASDDIRSGACVFFTGSFQ